MAGRIVRRIIQTVRMGLDGMNEETAMGRVGIAGGDDRQAAGRGFGVADGGCG